MHSVSPTHVAVARDFAPCSVGLYHALHRRRRDLDRFFSNKVSQSPFYLTIAVQWPRIWRSDRLTADRNGWCHGATVPPGRFPEREQPLAVFHSVPMPSVRQTRGLRGLGARCAFLNPGSEWLLLLIGTLGSMSTGVLPVPGPFVPPRTSRSSLRLRANAS